jgi:YD repeat-containing protein
MLSEITSIWHKTAGLIARLVVSPSGGGWLISLRRKTAGVMAGASRSVFRKGARRQLACLALMLSLLICPGPTSGVHFVSALASDAVTTVSYGAVSVWRLPLIIRSWFKRAPKAITLQDRIAAVAGARVVPNRLVGYTGQTHVFTAYPMDASATAVHGAMFIWDTSDHTVATVDEAGKVTMLKAGLCWVTCQAGTVQAKAPLLVKPGLRPRQTDAQWAADQNSLATSGVVTGGVGGSASALLGSFLDKLAPTVEAQGNGGAVDYLWNNPANWTGAPRNAAVEPTKVGAVLPESSNLDLTGQILSLGGRGLGVSLGFAYNTRIWFRNGSSIVYAPLQGFPGPGFTLGFGYIVTYTSPSPPYDTAYLLIDRDGTPRYMGHGGTGTYQTQDGTHITFTGSAGFGGSLTYKDGTIVTISIVNNNLLPTMIQDRNGNFFTIAYKDATQGYNPLAIDYITDTLGRVISFVYTGMDLASITSPAIGGGNQTWVNFGYVNQALRYSFSGLTPMNAPPSGTNVRELQYIQFPATNTGYQLSFSDYGMAYKISPQRQMAGAGPGGVESASATFNYPTSGSTQLTDAPAFTQRVESPNSGTYSYSSSTDNVGQTKTFTITRPDSSTAVLTRSTSNSSPGNGLMTQTELKSATGYSLAKSIYSYALDPGGSPQVNSVMTYDAAVATQENYDYDQLGNVVNEREFGFQQNGAWVVRRRTHVAYITVGGTIIVPTEVDLYDAQLNNNDADDILIAKTTYDVDNYNYPFPLNGIEDYSGTANPPGHYSSFNASYTTRGNLTAVTQWTDIAGNVSINRETRYDIFGNVAKAQESCCNQKSFGFDQTTYWATPTQITRGDPSGLHLTDTVAYDFDTLRATSLTDPANHSISAQYDADLRPIVANLPSGATASAQYNDGSSSYSQTISYVDLDANGFGVQKSLTNNTVTDGWGNTVQTTAADGGTVNITRDNLGRVQSQTLPFQAGGTPGPGTTYQYDSLGRPLLATLPDGNSTSYSYNGNYVVETNPVARQIRREYDGLGRLVKVTEQDSTGVLSQDTSYQYDLIDNLTQVTQGGRARSSKYDAIGRLLYERVPEQAATINDGTGTFWSAKYTYTDFSAIASRTDARGVVTTYSYDNLNRLYSIAYNISQAPGVAATPQVTYNFDTSSPSGTQGALLSVTIGSGYQESYGYDSAGRASSVTTIVNGKSYTVGYQRNQAGQTTQLNYPSGYTLPMRYDANGRLLSVGSTGNGPGLASGMTYNFSGQIKTLNFGNGVSQSLSYDPNRLELTGQTATKGGTTLMSLTYSYQAQAGQNGATSTAGNSGLLMSVSGSINGTVESATYTYDLTGRLASASISSGGSSTVQGYDLDRWGNRIGVRNSVSGGTHLQTVAMAQSAGMPTNKIASVTVGGTTTNYSYDANGNLSNDGLNTYNYDAENRLVSVGGGAVAQYSYDVGGRRVSKASGGSTTHYVWNGAKVLEEHDGSSGNNLVSYIAMGGAVIAKVSASAIRYFLRDRMCERLVLDSNATVVGQMNTLPYGEDFAESGEQDKHHYVDYERDVETGKDFAINRSYSPSVGAYTQASTGRAPTINDPQTQNMYNRIRGNPINRISGIGLGPNSGCPDGTILATDGMCYPYPLPTTGDTPSTPNNYTGKGCGLDVKFMGSLEKEDNLTFNFDAQSPKKLGPSTLAASKGDPVTGWFYRVEIFGELGPVQAKGWRYQQRITVYLDRYVQDKNDPTKIIHTVDHQTVVDNRIEAFILLDMKIPDMSFTQVGPYLADNGLGFFHLDSPGSPDTDPNGNKIWNELFIANITPQLLFPDGSVCFSTSFWVKVEVKEGAGTATAGPGALDKPWP